ncbi:MAG: hypothetical protein LBU88_09425 [Treponema sp.]|nr:hypothetical protein [Treponema sp.]
MQKKILVGVFIIICAAAFVTINLQYRYRKRQHSILQLIKEDDISPYINDGDIIFRLGDRIWSTYIKEMSPTDKRFSHLGIIRKYDKKVTVINAEGFTAEGNDFVNEVPLNDFLKSALSIGIYRIKSIEGKIISDTAMEFIGLPFDWQFDMEDNSKLYCTELLYVILKKLESDIDLNKIWVKEINKYVIPLDIYTQSEYFEEVGHWHE